MNSYKSEKNASYRSDPKKIFSPAAADKIFTSKNLTTRTRQQRFWKRARDFARAEGDYQGKKLAKKSPWFGKKASDCKHYARYLEKKLETCEGSNTWKDFDDNAVGSKYKITREGAKSAYGGKRSSKKSRKSPRKSPRKSRKSRKSWY